MLSARELDIIVDHRFHAPLLVRVPDAQNQAIALDIEDETSLDEKAKQFLILYGHLYGIHEPEQEFIVYRVLNPSGPSRTTHVKMGQRKHGLRVFGAELIAHFREGNLTSVSGLYIPEIVADPTPKIPKDEAIIQVQKELGSEEIVQSQSQSELVYLHPSLFQTQPSEAILAWRIPTRTQQFFVSALDGTIVAQYPLNDAARDRRVYASTRPDSRGALLMTESGFVYNPALIPDDIEDDAQHAYDFSGDTYDYYWQTFGRDSFDDRGGKVTSVVNFTSAQPFCPNAKWDHISLSAIFCDNMSDANDIVAHEFTHGVTQFSVGEQGEGLINEWQSGALGESYSDVFAAMIDQDDWWIGEDIMGITGQFRRLDDPTQSSPIQPDHVSSPDYVKYTYPCTPTNDNCGVHTNNGIPNKAAYLLGEHGTHTHYNVTVQGIGRQKTEQIYYNTLTAYLIPSSDFYSAGVLTEQSCEELVGSYGITSDDCDQVHQAFVAVGMATDVSWGADQRLTTTPEVHLSRQAVASDTRNRVHTIFEDMRTGSSQVYYKRSTNGGTSWRSDQLLSVGGTYASGGVIAADGQNRVHSIWKDYRGGYDDINYRRSTDGGATWGTITRITTLDDLTAHVTISADNQNRVHLAWGQSDGIYYRRSSDGGQTWGSVTRLNDAKPRWDIQIVADRQGRVHLAWEDRRDHWLADEVYVKRSTDGGATWGNDTRLSSNDTLGSVDPSIAVDTQGNAYVVWSDEKGGCCDLYYRRSITGGQTWDNEMKLTENDPFNGRFAVTPSITSDARDGIHIVWMNSRYGEDLYTIYSTRSLNRGLTWEKETRIIHESQYAFYPTITSDPQNRLHLVWEDMRRGSELYDIYYQGGSQIIY